MVAWADTGRPSTRTSSPAETRAASPATLPFTVTRPARISSSTARREPSPVEARNLLSLSGTLVGDQVEASAERLVHAGGEHSGMTDLDGSIGQSLAGQHSATPAEAASNGKQESAEPTSI